MGEATSYRDGVFPGVRSRPVQKTYRYTNKTGDEYCCSSDLAEYLVSMQVNKPLWRMAAEL